jgi:Amt family ammonium transporter
MRSLTQLCRRSDGVTSSSSSLTSRCCRLLLPTLALTALYTPALFAEDKPEPLASNVKFMVDNLWVLLSGCLVFIMHLGFASLESGLTEAKNTVNILFKNTMIICIGLLTYGLCGFALMYPGFEDAATGFFKFGGFGITKDSADATMMTKEYADYTWYTDFFFQAMFAATAATIVSGAVAGRIKLSSFLVWSTLFVGLCYPIVGSWKWGGGWLDNAGFYDFAGSTLVHSVGGWGALVMAILVGPRIAKFTKDGKANYIPGSNMPLVAIGVFLLWLGWFGFNGGSVLSGDPASISLVLVTTSMAAAAGGVTAGMVSWVFGKKPDLTMALNGILAGLVGITAGADQMAIWEAVAIGVVAGTLVYFSVVTIDKLRVDDPVGAISVHLVCGIWGTLAVGIFGAKAGGEQIVAQLMGIGSYAVATVVFAGVTGLIIKSVMGLRVSDDEQVEGLDIGEHGMAAYHQLP